MPSAALGLVDGERGGQKEREGEEGRNEYLGKKGACRGLAWQGEGVELVFPPLGSGGAGFIVIANFVWHDLPSGLRQMQWLRP